MPKEADDLLETDWSGHGEASHGYSFPERNSRRKIHLSFRGAEAAEVSSYTKFCNLKVLIHN
jgi:hypothetical protein